MNMKIEKEGWSVLPPAQWMIDHYLLIKDGQITLRPQPEYVTREVNEDDTGKVLQGITPPWGV